MSADQMIRAEIEKARRPRNKIAMGVGAGVAVLLTAGTIWGVSAANAYRADIEAMQAQIADDRAEAERLNAQTLALAAEAQESADAAEEAASAQLAAEEAAAAQAAAEAAAAAAAQSESQSNNSSGAPGSPVPFVASSDPNNASGGDYLDPGIYCQSGSASGNPPICD